MKELQSLIAFQFVSPALSNALGTAKWTPDDPFINVLNNFYWSSSSLANSPSSAWNVLLSSGFVSVSIKANTFPVWPVRGGP